ncbi:MAG: 2Fe-2S iron-sulfur cluster-binding protein [Pseudomonadota bacterium]
MKKTLKRLPKARVDTSHPISFTFEERAYRGFVGDTLASALLANGVAIVGRSFKLHRPRGLLAAGREEPNALVQLESSALTEPNARATLVPLYEGLHASGQNAWPSVRHDVFSPLAWCKRFLPASFYYKTLMWPSWRNWEWLIRRLAGLGRAPTEADPQYYIKQNVHADVVVVGAGRSGLKAALDAATHPENRVLLIDEQEELGGSLLGSPTDADRRWLSQSLEELAALPNVTVLSRTTVNGYYDGNVLAALERVTNHLGPTTGYSVRERLWRIYAGRVVLATGAIERPIVFPHNDRPGVMLASAAREYTHRYGLTLGESIVFYCNNDTGYHVALDMTRAGIPVSAIVDIRGDVDASLSAAAEDAGIRLYQRCAITQTHGRRSLRRVKIKQLSPEGDRLIGESSILDCDLLAMSGGWTPTVHLHSQAGGTLTYRENDACFVPDTARQSVRSVGRAAGDLTVPLNLRPQWLTPDVSPEHQWVDFQYDVTASDIQLAARENFVSVEHMKRYTTNGMSIDQGKTSNMNGLGVLATSSCRSIPEVGTTRFRPPYHPGSLGAYAGLELGTLFEPYRHLPAHEEHKSAGARFEDYGRWKRPAYYPQSGEQEESAIAREALAVRRSVGLLDYSSLGKIEVRGPHAREFLNRVYLNNVQTLKPGAARYALMLNESGIVKDDGIVICLAEDLFLLHTTSAGSSSVYQHLEECLQCEWPDLEVLLSHRTTQWSTMMLSGPNARSVLQSLDCDIDISRDKFSHMQYREGHILGQRCRILRASFTGEVSFEISVGASRGVSLWRELKSAGKPYGIVPFGIESLMLLRTEKGYLHIGQDTDGTTMPQDLGWAGAITRKPTDFIGRRSLELDVGKDGGRLQFTGIELLDRQGRISSGAHVLTEDGRRSAGYVTSAYHSPNLDKPVALGIVAGARARRGETVTVIYRGQRQVARLVAPCFLDPEGKKLDD